MKRNLFLLLLMGVLFATCTSAPVAKDGFVKLSNGRFVIDGHPYYYIGTNFWYGAILGSTGRGGDRERLLKELDYMKSKGITNLRVLVGADGKDGIPTKAEPALQTEAGVYNDSIFDGLDYLLAEMGKREMYAVLYLNNSWEWSGGYSQYLYWAGYGEVPMPGVAGWDTFSAYVGQYAQSEKAHTLFENHVRHVVSRVNRYNQKKYVDDPAIMSWQVGNEPRPFGQENKVAFAQWIARTAAIIKSIDPNHLISTGLEGMSGCEGDLNLWTSIHSDPNIDYTTIHIWPNNWGWIDKANITGTLDEAMAKTRHYIDLHLAEANKINKPMVMEEFGLPRDSMQFDCRSSSANRDRYYQLVFDYVKEHAKTNGLFQGCNFWAWGGFAQPRNLFWQRGDDYMGDPGQEEQGLNSVYNSDTTVDVVAQNVHEIDSILTKR